MGNIMKLDANSEILDWNKINSATGVCSDSIPRTDSSHIAIPPCSPPPITSSTPCFKSPALSSLPPQLATDYRDNLRIVMKIGMPV